jgi:hypothetical protein
MKTAFTRVRLKVGEECKVSGEKIQSFDPIISTPSILRNFLDTTICPASNA